MPIFGVYKQEVKVKNNENNRKNSNLNLTKKEEKIEKKEKV